MYSGISSILFIMIKAATPDHKRINNTLVYMQLVARMVVPKLGKNDHNSHFGTIASFLFQFRVNALKRDLNAGSGPKTIFNHFNHTHAR